MADHTCPHCGGIINIGKVLRQGKTTPAQAAAARANGKRGGRPRKGATIEGHNQCEKRETV